MTNTDLSALSGLLDEALELRPDAIEAWLGALPAQHRHLLPQLREMLSEHITQQHADFMLAGPKLDDSAEHHDLSMGSAGELVGAYRLLREIGRGGMGTVWLAERADGNLTRKVALKLPRLISGANLAERMARERDIGAQLEHSHIARLYDAGVDAIGRPYIAFEYIDGKPLDLWCESQILDVRERLRLFVQVVRAVAYAHGRLVVHRDLKPSNILVTADGQTHLLDFGIATLLSESVAEVDQTNLKAVERRAQSRTPGHATAPGDRLTHQGRVLTPHYASPEQYRGESITVASDVYSLGVLLYELLTGQLPYQHDKKSPMALESAVLKDEAPLASSRTADKSTAKMLHGEIDSILAKALRNDLSKRYPTADAFAEDIERYLNGENVQAQPDSVYYRLSKTLRRHRVGFIATGVTALAVMVGTGVVMVEAKRANDAAERARVVKEFVVDIFKVNTPDNAGNADLRKLPAEMLLEHGAGLIETKFTGQTQLQAELYGVVASIFIDIGATQQAIEYATKNLASLHNLNASQAVQANAMLLLAQALYDQKRYRESEAQVRRAMSLKVNDEQLALRARLLLTQALSLSGQIVDAERELASIEDTLRHQTPGPSVVRANAMHLRAQQMLTANRLDEALQIMNVAIDEALAAEGSLSHTAIDIRLSMTNSLISYKKPDQAKAPREAALTALRSIGGASEIRAAVEESQIARQMF